MSEEKKDKLSNQPLKVRQAAKMANTKIFISYLYYKVNNQNNYISVFAGGTGCQPKGSKVLMADGDWKNIEDVKIGDFVLSPQHNKSYQYSKVTELFKYKSKSNYEIIKQNPKQDLMYTCSDNHIIPFYNRWTPRVKGIRYKENSRWDLRECTAEKFGSYSDNKNKHTRIGFSAFPINKYKGRKNCVVEPYTLGVILGDGCFVKYERPYLNAAGKKTLIKKIGHLNITNNDTEVLKEVSQHYRVGNISTKQGTTALTYSFSVQGVLWKQLEKLGLLNHRSGTKFVPKEALLSDLDYRKKLLTGLIDTDGHYSQGGYSFTLKSKTLVENIKSLVYSIGGRSGKVKKVTKSHDGGKTVGTYYNLCFYIGDIELPLKCMKKLRNVPTCYLTPNRRSIKAVKTKGSTVYGFSIDSPSNWYITDNWMVTHNSGKSWAALSLGDMVDPNFCADNVVFTPLDFVRRVDTLIKEGQKGAVIVFDEAGTEGMSSRDWHSAGNKSINSLLQTFRCNNLILIITVPYASFIDSRARKLCDSIIQFNQMSIHKRDKISTGVIQKIVASQYNDKILMPYPKFKTKTGMLQMRNVAFPAAPRWLINDYEKKKADFNKSVRDKAERGMRPDLIEQEGVILTKRQQDLLQKYEIEGKFLREIAEERGVSEKGMSKAKVALEKKLKRKIV